MSIFDPDIDRRQRGTPSEMQAESDTRSRRLALEGPQLGQAYNEEAFRYFLALERKRSERSNRSFLLLLMDLKKHAGGSERLDHAVAAMLFSRLRLCLRETDFMGWYHEGRVAGAVLTQRIDAPGTDASLLVGQRVAKLVSRGLRSDLGHRLQVRVYQLPPKLKDEG